MLFLVRPPRRPTASRSTRPPSTPRWPPAWADLYLSFVAATADSTFTLGLDHWATEERIRASGVPFTFPRINLYMDFIPSMVGADGVIRQHAGDGHVADDVRDDVAAAAVALLTSDGHEGRSYELTGRKASTLAEARVALMSEHSGKTITFEDETEAQAYASRAGRGSAHQTGRCAAG